MVPPAKIRKTEDEIPSREPDCVSQFDVKDISKLDLHGTTRKIEPKGVPLKLCASKGYKSADFDLIGGSSDYLWLRILCPGNPSRLWRVHIKFEATLFNCNSKKSIVREWGALYDHSSLHCACSFLEWATLIDKSKGFIKDNAIKLEFRIWVVERSGFRTDQLIDIDQPGEPFHDVSFLIADQKIYASKQFLAIHSPVFKSMLFGPYQEKDEKEIPLEDIDPKEFREMLLVMYPSEHRINDENVGFLLKLADRFQIKMLLDRAESYLIAHSTLDNSEKLLLSDKYRLVSVQGQCLSQFETPADIRDLRQSAQFKELSDAIKSVLLEIMCDLTERSENSDYYENDDYN